jgi:GH24 family phage-related lysozyme (muramidase)
MAGYKNIVGTPFLDYVQDQIEARTKLLNKKDRSSSDLQYATNRNSWIRLSSGAIISSLPPDQLLIRNLAQSDTDLQVQQNNIDSTFVTDLAQTNVLQGGTISSGGDRTIIKQGFDQTYTQGATDKLGFKPMPGITNVTVGTGGKWQTLMQAEVEFICYDLDQLDLMTKLYMSLGVTVFLEWGHTPYLDNNGQLQTNVRPLDFFSPNFNTKEKLLQEVTKKRESSFGNYDGILGTVYNFSWSANNDGSYNCKTQIMGPGGMVESLRINTSNNIDLDEEEGDESEKYSSVLENALFSLKKYFKSSVGVITAVTKNGDYEDRGSATTSTKGFQKISLLDEPLMKSTREKFPNYSSFLKSIYKSSTYKSPQFKTGGNGLKNLVDYPNTNSQYGNAWQKIAGIEDNTISPLTSDFYAGYVGYFKSFEDDSSLFNTYITFGHLMSLIQHLGIFTEGDSTTPESTNLKPVVYIDYNPDNTTILRGSLEASIDPTTCIVPWFVKGSIINGKKTQTLKPFFSPLDVSKISSYSWFGGSLKDGNILKNFLAYPEKNSINKAIGKDSFEGKLFDVLINIDFALNKLKNLSSGTDDRSVSLISFIDAILDGINLSLGKANNFRAFADPLYPVIRIIDENVIEPPTKFLEVPIYGTKSIVYDYGFSSKITPKLASQIVIATQGLQNGGIKGFPDDVLSYQKLNNDVRDRFAKSKFPAVKSTDFSTQPTEEKRELKSLQKLYDHIYNVYSNEEDKSLSSSTISNLTTFYSDLQNKQRKLSKTTNPGGILLPIEYDLTLDGISGILPYNAFKIPDNRLPKKYRGRVAFAIFSINHSFSNNQWTTKLRGQTLLLDQTPIADNRKLSDTPEKRIPQSQITPEEQEAINTTYPGVVNTTAFELTPTPNPTAVGTQSDLDQEPPTQTGTINPTTTVSPIATAQENDIPAILNFIRAQEGFETSPYDDRGSLRIGFGSDTITRTDGTIESVKPNSIVNEAEANLDLQRRITQEFKPKVQVRCRELGVDYNQLPLKVKVVFVDCAYNYGSLWYDIIRSYINGGVNGLIDELQARINRGASQVPSRRAAEIKYLQG